MLASWRFSLGSLLFLVFMKLGGHSFPNKGRRLAKLALLGLVQTTLLQAFFFIGLSLTTVGKVSVFMNSQPLYVALLAPYMVGEKRFNRAKAFGIILGFIGISAVFAKELIRFSVSDLLGALLTSLGAISWSVATLWAKNLMKEDSLITVNTVQMLAGAIPLLALGYAFEGMERVVITGQVLYLLAFLVVVCTFLPYLMWYTVLRANPAAIISSFNFLAVIFGIVLGILVLGEPLAPILFVGAAFVSLGIYFVNRF